MGFAFAGALCACSVLIDRDRFEDGSAGSVAGGAPEGGSPTQGGAPSGGHGGAAPALECLNAQVHAGFDPPNDAYRGFLLEMSVGDAGSVVTEPTSDVRHGSGAFRIALTEEDQYAWLRSLAIDDEDVAYWVGFSQRMDDLALTRGTMTFALECNLGQDPWQRLVFGLEMDPDTPGLPYRSNGLGIVDPEETGRGFDDLDQIPGDKQYSDWALHVKLSKTDAGYVDVYHAGTRVFSAPGRNVPDPKVETCQSFDLRFGIYRWDGFGDGGADAAPLAQTLFLDELVLLQVDETPELDARALFTLDPDSNCF